MSTQPVKSKFNTICNIIIILGLCLMLIDVYAWQKRTQARYQQDMTIFRQLATSMKIYSNDAIYVKTVADEMIKRSAAELEEYSPGKTFELPK